MIFYRAHGKGKGYALTALKLVIAILILSYLVRVGLLDFAKFPALVTQPALIVYAVAAMLANLFISTYRWWLLLKTLELKCSLRECLLPNYMGTSMNPVLPGRISGDIIRVSYVLRRYPDMHTRALTSLLMDRLVGFAGLLVLSCVVLLADWKKVETVLAPLQGAPVICWVATALLLAGTYTSRHVWGGLLLLRFPRLKDIAAEFGRCMALCRQNVAAMLLCLCLSMVMQLVASAMIWAVALHAGFDGMDLWSVVLASALAQVVAILPVSPGGVGISEGGFALGVLLLHPDVHASYSSIYFTYRAITLLVMLPGMLLYFTRKDY